jgi:hypothetical protein
MSKQLKRVPVDFDWPIAMEWKGYRNPMPGQKCLACNGSGYNEPTRRLGEQWYDFEHGGENSWCSNLEQAEVDALIANGRLYDFTHVWTPADGWKPKNPMPAITAEQVNAWHKSTLGHDAINRIVCVRERAKRLGVYGLCHLCDGRGEVWANRIIRWLSEHWRCFDPPAGKGYQVWESRTSPLSPVFKTLDEICEYAAANLHVFGYETASADEWRRMLGGGLVYKQEGNRIFIG